MKPRDERHPGFRMALSPKDGTQCKIPVALGDVLVPLVQSKRIPTDCRPLEAQGKPLPPKSRLLPNRGPPAVDRVWSSCLGLKDSGGRRFCLVGQFYRHAMGHSQHSPRFGANGELGFEDWVLGLMYARFCTNLGAGCPEP